MVDIESVMPDVGHLDLSDLFTRADPVLADALNRILEQSTDHDIVAGFNSAL